MNAYECLKGKKIMIWGTGLAGENTYHYLKCRCQIEGFYDSDSKKWGTQFCGKTISKWDFYQENELIIIASEAWREIIKLFENTDMCLFSDFVPYTFFLNGVDDYSLIYECAKIGSVDERSWKSYRGDKKIAVTWGGCQGKFLAKALSLDETFRENYNIISFPEFFAIHFKERREAAEACIEDSLLWKQIDLFIYYVITEQQETDGRFRSDYVLGLLNEECQCVSVSRINFSGYFPQIVQKSRPTGLNDKSHMYQFDYKDFYVWGMLEKGYDTEEILEQIKKEDFISEKRVKAMFKYSLLFVKEMEKELDVSMYDYIETHCREEQLFYSIGHPRTKLLVELAVRVLRYIFTDYESNLQELYSDEDIHILCGSLKGLEHPVYPAVAKALGLQDYENRYWINRYTGFRRMLSFEEYMREYIFWAKEEMSKNIEGKKVIV